MVEANATFKNCHTYEMWVWQTQLLKNATLLKCVCGKRYF